MEQKKLDIAVAQIALEVGNIEENLEKVKTFHMKALKENAELVVFPELSLSGYTLGDEIGRYAFTPSHPIFQELLEMSQSLPMVIGYVERSPRGRIYNSAVLVDGGNVVHTHRKVYLPNYSLWEEQKRFAKGRRMVVFPYRGFRFAMFVCNDFWYPSLVYLAAANDADVFIVIANSALDVEGMNPRAWDMLIRGPALLYGGFVVFANRVGTEHGWSFWGGSTVVSPFGLSAKVAETGEELFHSRIEHDEIESARDALPIIRDMDTEFTLRELKAISQQRFDEND